MRAASKIVALVVAFVAVQIVTCDPEPHAQRQRFLDDSPFSQPRRPRGGPLPPPGFVRPRPRNQRQLPRGPRNQPLPAGFPQHPEELPSIGQLPLNPRPMFSGPRPQALFNQEQELEEDFVSVLHEDEEEQGDGGDQNQYYQQQQQQHQEQQQQQKHHQQQQQQQPHAEERSSPEPDLEPTSAPETDQSEPLRKELRQSFEAESNGREDTSILHETLFSEPDHPFRGHQRLEKQETQDIEFLSAPPQTNIRKRNTARPHRPAHPNQIPVYHEVYNQHGELVEEGEEVEEEEPDRLAILLLDSKFSCSGKNNGYYADEEVHCEIFHYCQDLVKHSWLCPEGASFHQVHLICMPRSEDNICARSSTFHFVNDFLYKELDGPNKTYADRYYPEGFAHGMGGVSKQHPIAIAEDIYQNQNDRFPVTQKTHRPSATFQNQSPPTYQPAANVQQHSGQSFQPEQGIVDRVQQSVPEFQSGEHFSGVIGQQHSQSFQPTNDFGGSNQGQFSAFHSPEEVRVQRPRFRPGRRPGHFNRHQVQIG